jgi:hypothetical protein
MGVIEDTCLNDSYKGREVFSKISQLCALEHIHPLQPQIRCSGYVHKGTSRERANPKLALLLDQG